jgi:hypothetical protein
VVNIFNRGTVIGVNSTVVTLTPFNPFTETPVEGVHWRKAARANPAIPLGGFGDAASATSANYQQMRTYRVSFGARF